MPLKEFWNDDPDLLWVYRDLYIQKLEQEQEIMNYNAWLQGVYMCYAIASVFSKGTKYLEKPIEFNSKPKTKQEQNLTVMQKVKAQAVNGQAILEQRGEIKG